MKIWLLFSLSEVQLAYNYTVKSLPSEAFIASGNKYQPWKCDNLKAKCSPFYAQQQDDMS